MEIHPSTPPLIEFERNTPSCVPEQVLHDVSVSESTSAMAILGRTLIKTITRRCYPLWPEVDQCDCRDRCCVFKLRSRDRLGKHARAAITEHGIWLDCSGIGLWRIDTEDAAVAQYACRNCRCR